MLKKYSLVYLFFLGFTLTGFSQEQLKSPNGRLNMEFNLDAKGIAYYSLTFENQRLLAPSKLGFKLKEQDDLLEGFKIKNVSSNSSDERWSQVWGERKEIRDHFNELKIELVEDKENARQLNIFFRLYDDGFAFRYEIPEQEYLKDFIIMSEESEFALTDNHKTWWIWADYNTYEKLYQETSLKEATWAATPVTMKSKEGIYLSFHEANLTDYAGMTFKQKKGSLTYKSELVPWANGDKVRTSAPMKTPWRTVQVSEDAKGLTQSDLILNLNEPNKLEDTSWIQPMKYIGIWWGMHIGTQTWHEGDRHGATTENALKYIDFAKAHQIEGVVFEGWNDGWANWGGKDAFDQITPAADFDFEKVAKYAHENGVEMMGHHETGGDIPSYEKFMDDAFKLCQDNHVKAVKTGYAGGIYPRGEHHHGQFMVRHYRKVVETAAKYQIMLNVHEPIKDTGIRRTYPNMMTREGVRGMEWNGWSDGNPPSHTCILPFTRQLSGPLDYTPGIFDPTYETAGERVKWNALDQGTARVQTTVAKQLALAVVLYSPFQMSSDVIENYVGDPAFKFLEDFNADCDESITLNGEIGEFITVARRSDTAWFVGSITNEDKRELKISLDFLEEGKKYKAGIYADAKDADWKTNPTAIHISSKVVEKGDTLIMNLAKGGGQAISLIPIE
ncbi:glycoside hydrolase family 97 protein [Sediminitomix flava]|uniref:Alpha-glucosidase n=1 Tax=Sediminitomix flava TaxID=379075 RepID=A0A315ZBD9_SEDFL|nr:glycoside hydrolase family 97 protein [Sediminitomix flava]PWJ42118.1 alpha-glucosidase [Sediminitomix flava]